MTSKQRPACYMCKHFSDSEYRRCSAFGDKAIPDQIWDGGNPHDQPVDGDGGVTFEAKSEDDEVQYRLAFFTDTVEAVRSSRLRRRGG